MPGGLPTTTRSDGDRSQVGAPDLTDEHRHEHAFDVSRSRPRLPARGGREGSPTERHRRDVGRTGKTSRRSPLAGTTRRGLAPLHPRYVSTVDSGNLAAAFDGSRERSSRDRKSDRRRVRSDSPGLPTMPTCSLSRVCRRATRDLARGKPSLRSTVSRARARQDRSRRGPDDIWARSGQLLATQLASASAELEQTAATRFCRRHSVTGARRCSSAVESLTAEPHT